MRRVILIGGSNSLLKKGWTAQLFSNLAEFKCVNRSVGAANSAMGYFRLTNGVQIAPSDIIVWEYSLNDENWIGRGHITIEFALKYVELCIQFAIRHGAVFIPVVLASRANPEFLRDVPYTNGLNAMFSAYGLDPVRATDLYCEKYSVTAVPSNEYLNLAHYRLESDALTLVAEKVARKARASVPAQPATRPERGAKEQDVAFCSAFSEGHSFEFTNSAMSFRVSRPFIGRSMIVDIPVGRWSVAAIIMLKVIRPGRYEFLFGNRSVIIPIGNHRFETDKPLLLTVPTKLGDLIEVDETTTVTVNQLALSPAARKIAGKGGDEPENYGIVAIHLEAR